MYYDEWVHAQKTNPAIIRFAQRLIWSTLEELRRLRKQTASPKVAFLSENGNKEYGNVPLHLNSSWSSTKFQIKNIKQKQEQD